MRVPSRPMGAPKSWARRASFFAPLGMAALGISAELLWGGQTDVGGTFAFFLGRFHPLIVHLPIGGLILLSLFEALPGRATPSAEWRRAIDALLVATVVSAAAALVLGHLLAQEGGVAAGALAQHRWLAATAGVLVAVALWVHQSAPVQDGKRLRYRVALGASLLVLSGAAHVGGTLSRGESYLGKYAPAWLAPLLGGGPRPVVRPAVAAKPSSDAAGRRLFTDVVLPILIERCGDCHGREVTKAQFSVLSLEALKQGGKSGSALNAKEPMKSLLWLRIEEPLSHDEHMPPADETQLTPGEHAVLEFWLKQGRAGDPDLSDLLPSAEAWPLLTRGSSSAANAQEPLPTATHAAEPNSEAQTKAEPGAITPTEGAPVPNSSPRPTPAPEPLASAPADAAASAGTSAFAILRTRCTSCHGAEKQKGSLRVDSVEAIWRGGKGGPALNADAPAQSSLLVRITLPIQDDDHMPPAGNNQLTSPERETLRRFVLNQAARQRSAPSSASEAAPASSHALPSNQAGGPPSLPSEAQAGPSAVPASANEPTTSTKPPDLPAWSRAAFERDVLPVLSRSCTLCHDDTAASGKLRLDSLEAAVRGGRSGPAIMPGEPDKSVLLERISLPAGHDDRMPPADEPPLPSADAQLIRSWITHALDPSPPAEFELRAESNARDQAEHASGTPTDPPRAAPGPGQGGFLGCGWARPPQRTDGALFALIALAGCVFTARYRKRRIG